MPLGGQQYIIVDQKQQQKQQQAGKRLSSGGVHLGFASEQAENGVTNNTNTNKRQQSNAPYCLKCFDMVFGETCEQCGKLITCDSGAINHERRCWHASANCFKCYRCAKSLLGSPFLPSSDGLIYCSLRCSEAFHGMNSSALPPQQHQQQANKPVLVGQPSNTGVIAQSLAGRPNAEAASNRALTERLHLANYCDPRAPHGALQHQLTLSASSNALQPNIDHNTHLANKQHSVADPNNNNNNNSSTSRIQRVGLLRHKALIDYLLTNASSDETSHQLLNYLYNQFRDGQRNKLDQFSGKRINGVSNDDDGGDDSHQLMLSTRDEEREEEQRLMEEIRNTMELIARERASLQMIKSGLQNESTTTTASAKENAGEPNADRLRRNKLNPFLIDSFGAATTNNGNGNNNNGLNFKAAASAFMMNDQHRQQVLANYINLDCINLFETDSSRRKLLSNKSDNRICSIASSEVVGNKAANVALDGVDNALACSPTRPTILTKLAAGKQQQHPYSFKASQCSPAASLASNEGTISDHSATSSGVSSSTAPPCNDASGTGGGGGGSNNSNNNNHDGSQKSHSPLSSTSSHSSVSSSSSSSAGASASAGGGGNFRSTGGDGRRPINSIAATLERRRRVQPITELSVLDLLSAADDQLEQQRQRNSDGFEQLVSHFESSRRSQQQPPFNKVPQQVSQTRAAQFKLANPNQQSESFFYELAQRLPKAQVPAQRAPVEGNTGKHHLMAANSCWPMQLDTNGLPSVESGGNETAAGSSNATRTITDHYSTVNKAPKLLAARQQQVGESKQQQQQEENNFFSITMPLLSCQTDNANHSMQRPTSSMSMLTASSTSGSMTRREGLLHASYSTGSLIEGGSESTTSKQTSSLQPAGEDPAAAASSRLATTMTSTSALSNQKTNSAKPAKSVSFDPAVKDPPSSGSMTLGRNSALKSALKSSSMSWLPANQDQLSFELQQQQQQQAQFAAACSGGGTMPSSLASQLRSGGSLSAYSAYYDEYGRRIRLSSLLAQPPQLAEEGSYQTGEAAPKKSLLSGAISKLTTSQSSRGGRRKLREQQQQQQVAHNTVLTTQPTSTTLGDLFVQPISEQQLQQMQMAQQQHLIPSTSGLQAAANSADPSATGRRGGRHHQRRAYSSSSRRRPSTRRGRTRRGSRQEYRGTRGKRYCTDANCCDSGDDDSSRCSTCSSSSDDDDDDYSDASDSSRCSSSADSSSSSQTPYSSSDCSSSHSEEDDDDDQYDYTGSSSSGSSRSSSACSSHSGRHRNTGSSRASSPSTAPACKDAGKLSSRSARHGSRGGGHAERRHQRHRRTSTSSKGQQTRAERRSARSGCRSSRSSSHSSSSRSSSRRSGNSARRKRSSHHDHERRRRHRKSSASRGKSSSSSSSQHRHHAASGKSSRSSRSVAHLQPPPVNHMQLPPQQFNQHQFVGHPNCFIQQQPPPTQMINPQATTSDMGGHHQHQHLLRAKSPSTVSTDSKSVNSDCRII